MARPTGVNDDRMRILVLADSRSFHAERYVRELRRQGCRVLPASLEHGALHHYHLKQRGFVWFLRGAASVPEIRLLIKRFAPHVVNPHFASGYGFSAAMACGGALPIALHLWGSDVLVVPKKSVFHRNKTRFALATANCVFADSEYLRNAAQDVGKIKESHIIPWGIERRYVSLHKAGQSLSRPLKVIVPRPHEAVYNNQTLLAALAPLLRQGDVHVAFPGWGSMLEENRRLAAGIDAGAVSYYHRMSRDQFMAFAAQHDVYLSGSLSDSSPASLIEAMALGLIPIAADIPGVREWLAPDSGFLFSLETPERLGAILAGIAAKPDSLAQMRRRNLATVVEKAIFEDNIRATIDIMRRMAGRGRDA